MALIDLEQAKEVVRDSCKKIPTMAIVTMQNLEKLPTIEPRKGKWIYSREHGTAKVWTCSECGWNDIGEWNFCSNCGADMREVTE